eukprot:m.127306 g.127306  ORF g.127306 m.127306 type:complete len:123 (-) comp14543_c0_seq1:1362-1730(-)
MSLLAAEVLMTDEVAKAPASFIQKEVRVTGKIKTYDARENNVILELAGCELRVDVALVEPTNFKETSLFQFLGTFQSTGEGPVPQKYFLKARIAKCVNGLDIALFRKALEIRRSFLKDLSVS